MNTKFDRGNGKVYTMSKEMEQAIEKAMQACLNDELRKGSSGAQAIDWAAYPYVDENGIDFIKVRFNFSVDGKREKTYKIFSSDKEGNVLFKIPEKPRHYLYNADYLAAASAEKTLYIVEGEKCADAATAAGLLATSFHAGAQRGLKYTAADRDLLLKFDSVILIPDNDEKGKDLIKGVDNLAAGAMVLDLKEIWQDIPPKGDIADYLAGHDVSALMGYQFPPSFFGAARGADDNEIVRNALERFEHSQELRKGDWKVLAADELYKNNRLLAALACAGEVARGRFKSKVTAAKVISATDFKNLVNEIGEKIAAADFENHQKEQGKGTIAQLLKERGDKIPANYIYDADGMSVIELRNGERVPKLFSPAIIVVDKIFIGREGARAKYLARLAYIKDGKYILLPVVEYAVIKDRRKLAELFSSLPNGIHDKNALAMIEHWCSYIAANEKENKAGRAYFAPGWYGDKFVLEDSGEIYLTLDDENLKRELASKGNLTEWLEMAQDIRKSNHVARFMLAAAFAAPLVPLVSSDGNFLFMIWGRGGAGKTFLLKACASAWGAQEYYKTQDATINAMEAMAISHNNLPVILDEATNTSNSPGAALDKLRMVYRLFNGKERGRMNKNIQMRETRTWKNVFLVSGESPLLDDNATGGAMRRILELKFDGLTSETRAKISKTIKDNYGVAARKFVAAMEEIGKEEISKLFDEFLREMKSLPCADGKEETLLRGVALVLTADYIFSTRVIGADAAKEESAKEMSRAEGDKERRKAADDIIAMAASIIEQLPSRDRVDDWRRAYDSTQQWIAENYTSFSYLANSDYGKSWRQISAGKSYGVLFDGKACIIPDVLKKALKEMGFNPGSILSQWKDNAVTETDKGRVDKTKRLPTSWSGKNVVKFIILPYLANEGSAGQQITAQY